MPRNDNRKETSWEREERSASSSARSRRSATTKYDSYPDGYGLQNLEWLRVADFGSMSKLATVALVVDNDVRRPTERRSPTFASSRSISVSEGSLHDWYCLLHKTHGDIGAMLDCGYIEDAHRFPLDSLFCEWAYIVDFDSNMFEVYVGFQTEVPKRGRWPVVLPRTDRTNHLNHLAACKQQGRDPYLPEVPDYKAVDLLASWPLDALPSDGEFLSQTRVPKEVEP